MHFRARLTLVLVATLGSASLVFAQAADPARLLEDISGSIQDPGAFELARCELRAALLGRYNVRVRTAARASADGNARILSISGGRLTVGADATPLTSNLAVVEQKTGRLQVASPQDAFREGLPFYIDDVKVVHPGLVSYAVVSNPGLKVEQAFARLEKTIGTFTGETVETTKVFGSRADSQRREFSIAPALTEDVVAHLSIVTLGANDVRCLSSNEVLLQPR